jgi:hypothetical protein
VRCLAALITAVALILPAACARTPSQPEPLTDCTILGAVVPAVLQVGETGRMSAYLEHCRPMYLPLSPEQVGWQSLDPSVASVSADTITALARGTAVVQVTYGRMTQQALVVVSTSGSQPLPPVPARFRIYGCPEMSVLQRCAFGAISVATDGTVSRVSSSATWSSSDPSVAGISGPANADQGVDGFRAGTARISALYQGVAATLGVQVHQN